LRHSVWITALVILTVLQMSQAWLLKDLVQEEMRAGIARSEAVPEEQKDVILQRMEETYATPAAYVRQSLFGAAGNVVLSYLLPAALYLLVLNFVLGARASFREVLAVTAFSNLIVIVRDLIRVPIILAKSNLYVFLSPAAFADPENRALIWALDRFDLFALYRLGLLALGFAAIAGLAPRRAAIPVVIVWLLVGLAGVGFMLSPIGRLFG
jgi:hypothetical protein